MIYILDKISDCVLVATVSGPIPVPTPCLVTPFSFIFLIISITLQPEIFPEFAYNPLTSCSLHLYPFHLLFYKPALNLSWTLLVPVVCVFSGSWIFSSITDFLLKI